MPALLRVINLASNENSVGPSDAVLDASRVRLAEANRYPEASAAALRAALACAHGLKSEWIVCANGSSELISLIAHAYTSPGDEILIGCYGYLFFDTAARIAGAVPVRIPSSGTTFDPEAALDAVTPRTRILFLDNPNNPTGSHVGASTLRKLRLRLREDILLVLDAAYAEYVTDPSYEAGVTLVEAGDNCVMLRTFSKIYGLAGFRVGWAYAPPEVADALHRVRQPNNLAGPSLAAAEAALREAERVVRIKAENAHLRDAFSTGLQELGFNVHSSQGNFVMVDIGHDAAGVYEVLKHRGIIVRPLAPYSLPNCLRITIGTAAEMTEVVRTLGEIGRQ